MPMPRRLLTTFTVAPYAKFAPVAGALAALLISSSVYAANFGHSRILSAPGKPLAIDVPVSRLSDQDLATLKLAPAPAAAWSQAGLTPPVALDSLSLQLVDGIAPGKRTIQVRSTQPFGGSVADLLLDISTASGQQRYQVSLLTQAAAVASPVSATASHSGAGTKGSAGAASALASIGSSDLAGIAVKRGDTLFSIARQHAVPGVTVYQMMIALQGANPQAFIHGNLNLLRADTTLTMPAASALTAISDSEARRVFQQHAQAFANYRQGSATSAAITTDDASQGGTVGRAGSNNASSGSASSGDQLRLSGNSGKPGSASTKTVGADGTALLNSDGTASGNLADDRLAASKGITDAESRVSQLEENVKNLNRAFQSQGEAAKELIVEGAKGIGQSFSDMTSSVTDSTASGTANKNSALGESPVAAAGSGNNRAGNINEPVSQKAALTVSWLQENLLAVIGGALAFIVLIIAWLLRRANAGRNAASAISPAMVKQKLDEINLDLDQPATNNSPANKS